MSLTAALPAEFVPGLVTEMVEVGESTGALPAMLNSVSEFYEEELDARLAGALRHAFAVRAQRPVRRVVEVVVFHEVAQGTARRLLPLVRTSADRLHLAGEGGHQHSVLPAVLEERIPFAVVEPEQERIDPLVHHVDQGVVLEAAAGTAVRDQRATGFIHRHLERSDLQQLEVGITCGRQRLVWRRRLDRWRSEQRPDHSHGQRLVVAPFVLG